MAALTVRGRQWAGVDRVFLAAEEYDEDAREISAKRVYRTLYAGWRTRAPLIGSPHPTYGNLMLFRRTAKQIVPGALADVTLEYRKPTLSIDDPGGGGGGGGGTNPDPTEGKPTNPPEGLKLPLPRQVQNASQIQIPIQQHPNWTSQFKTHWDYGTNAWKSTAPDYLQGVTSYIVGSVTRSTTTYFWSKPSGVENVVGARSGNWLTISGSVQQEGLYWSKTITELYSTKGWPSQIYG